MKKRLFFYIVGVVALIAGAISCTNNDFEESIPQEQPKRTRAVRTMTADEVQARLDELNEKYDANLYVNINDAQTIYDEDFFLIIENVLRKQDCKNLLTEYPLQEQPDETIDFFSVASTAQRSIQESINSDKPKEFDGSWSETVYFPATEMRRRDGCLISPFIQHGYNIAYTFHYGQTSKLEFTGFSDCTNANIENLPNNYSHLNQDDVDELHSMYTLNYIDSSMELNSNISASVDNPTGAKDYNFAYTFMITIDNINIQVIARHHSNVYAFNVLE